MRVLFFIHPDDVHRLKRIENIQMKPYKQIYQ